MSDENKTRILEIEKMELVAEEPEVFSLVQRMQNIVIDELNNQIGRLNNQIDYLQETIKEIKGDGNVNN
ncbi:hypothetical protein [Pseudolactococcus reticulitermitis]|uniref:Uncharacterized protein n=1 Tax=Pseudolactococcus reticulitermitis TaxID=2025039 RepID=A0A224XAS2_9LACT|nr:hypothetical protein [Lactococcus reticulitermitis]GAX46761.1 hypothetical protein RsY01_340 [Lactococcus reticulitermitis]